MSGILKIEILPTGIANVAIGHTNDQSEIAYLWRLYRALRAQILELERVAQREAVNLQISGLK